MFEYSKNIMDKIKNKEELNKNEFMYIERSLRISDATEEILNYQIKLNDNNVFELTERI